MVSFLILQEMYKEIQTQYGSLDKGNLTAGDLNNLNDSIDILSKLILENMQIVPIANEDIGKQMTQQLSAMKSDIDVRIQSIASIGEIQMDTKKQLDKANKKSKLDIESLKNQKDELIDESELLLTESYPTEDRCISFARKVIDFEILVKKWEEDQTKLRKSTKKPEGDKKEGSQEFELVNRWVTDLRSRVENVNESFFAEQIRNLDAMVLDLPKKFFISRKIKLSDDHMLPEITRCRQELQAVKLNVATRTLSSKAFGKFLNKLEEIEKNLISLQFPVEFEIGLSHLNELYPAFIYHFNEVINKIKNKNWSTGIKEAVKEADDLIALIEKELNHAGVIRVYHIRVDQALLDDLKNKCAHVKALKYVLENFYKTKLPKKSK